jgi:hypothetical protein
VGGDSVDDTLSSGQTVSAVFDFTLGLERNAD